MKVLSIGNSFSHDAHKWLHKLAKCNGVDIQTANLFIGGCSLETHFNNLVENRADYDYEINGEESQNKISICEALKKEKWDVVTLQQASSLSGMYESFEPYLSNLAAAVVDELPDAKLYFHRTWAYEIDSEHPGFINYGNNQQKMYESIVKASTCASEKINAKIIPTGDIIQKIRTQIPEFDYENGGNSLCRDGFHLSFDYGRFAASAVWFKTITGKNVEINEFEDFNIDILKKLTDLINDGI